MNLAVLLFACNMVAKTTGGLIFANYVRALRQLRVTKTILKNGRREKFKFFGRDR